MLKAVAVDKTPPATAPDNLAGVMAEFVLTAEAAGRWATKWKTKAALIERNIWAFAGDDGKIKVVGLIIATKANGPAIHATQVYLGAEWAIRCGTNLAIAIGDRLAIIKAEAVSELFSLSPYVGESGVMIGLGHYFSKPKDTQP